MPISSVIFDFGCVLSLTPTLQDFAPLQTLLGVTPEIFDKIYWQDRENFDLDAIDAAAYWGSVAKLAGTKFAAEQIAEIVGLDIQVWERPNQPMIEWARVLRGRGLSTPVLSNMSRAVGDYLRRTARWLDEFQPLCFSGELKMAKPDAAIYHACLKAVGVPAAQTLFIDDREVNISTARSLGMNGIVFHSAETLLPELEPYALSDTLVEALKRVG